MAVLDDILTANARAAGKLPALDQDWHASRHLCVITCIDPRLTRFLTSALGIDRGEATLVRLPGPVVGAGDDLLRAVATAVFANDCNEILVLAHTDCALVRCDASALTSAMSKRFVDRAAMPADVRGFFGLAASPRQIATTTAGALRASPLLPADLLIHSAVIDTQTGALEIIERAENIQPVPKAAPGSAPSAFAPGSSSFGASGPSSFSGSGLASSLGASGPSSFGGLSSGFGLGVHGFSATPTAPSPSGPVSMPGPTITAPVGLRSSVIDFPKLDFASTIDLKPSVQLSPSGAPQTFSQSMAATSQIAPDRPLPIQLNQPLPPSPPAPPPSSPRRQQQQQAPAPQRPPPRKPQQQQQRQAPARSVSLSAQLASNVEKVSAFYRAEMGGSTRQEAASALENAYRGGSPNAELIRVVFKPILESGPKRYRVIDELLAIKEAAASMDRNDAYSVLRLLVQ